jgi:hypothetical protein
MYDNAPHPPAGSFMPHPHPSVCWLTMLCSVFGRSHSGNLFGRRAERSDCPITCIQEVPRNQSVEVEAGASPFRRGRSLRLPGVKLFTNDRALPTAFCMHLRDLVRASVGWELASREFPPIAQQKYGPRWPAIVP